MHLASVRRHPGSTMRRPLNQRKRRGRRWILPLLALGVFAVPVAKAIIPLTGSQKAAYHKQIERDEQQWQTALIANDTDTMASLLEEDYVGIGPDGTIASKSQELQARASGQDRIQVLAVVDRKIRIYGTTAVVTSRVHLQGVYSGQPLLGDYRYTRVWSLVRGQWRIVSFEANRIHDATSRSR